MFEQMQGVHNNKLSSTPLSSLKHKTRTATPPDNLTKPIKLEPLQHKIPHNKNNLAGLRLPVNYSGKWRDWNEPEIFGLQDLQNNNKSL